jgi:hypothetical protein
MGTAIHSDKSQRLTAGQEGKPLVDARPPAPDSQPESFVDTEAIAIPMVTSGVIDTILEVGRQRKLLLDQLRSALQSGNDAKALQLARQLCGLEE